jgi:hypothetical protein
MTIHAADATTRIGHLLSGKRIAAACDNQATASPAPGTARHPLEDDRNSGRARRSEKDANFSS